MRLAGVVAPTEAEVVHVESDGRLVNECQDLKPGQIAKLIREGDLAKLAVNQTRTGWLQKRLGCSVRVEGIVSDQVDPAIRRPTVGASNPDRIGINPIRALMHSGTRSKFAV